MATKSPNQNKSLNINKTPTIKKSISLNKNNTIVQVKPTIFSALKKDIINPNGGLNWPGILYTIAIPISLFAVFNFIKSAYLAVENPTLFHTHDLVFSLLYLGLILCKIPYFADKPLALCQFVVLALLWAIASILMSYAYSEYILSKHQNK